MKILSKHWLKKIFHKNMVTLKKYQISKRPPLKEPLLKAKIILHVPLPNYSTMGSISLLDSGHVVIYCQEKLSRNSDPKLKTVWYVRFLTRIKMSLILIYKDSNLKFLERFLLKKRRKFQNNPMAKRTINKLMVWVILLKK